jgi:ABC-type multidrug transport system permease subunit
MENQDLKQNILDRIKKDDVKMTSRQYFILKWFTLFVTSTFFLFVSFYLFAYIVFIFVDNGLVYIPLSTFDGLVSFIVEIPWTLVFDCVIIVL